MIKELKYISISVFRSLKHEVKSATKASNKPKEIMTILFYIMLIQFFTEKYELIPITFIFYFATYVWKVIRRGEWKHLMRNDYYKK